MAFFDWVNFFIPFSSAAKFPSHFSLRGGHNILASFFVGELTLKEAYIFKALSIVQSWASSVWSRDIPLAKSLVVWKLMLETTSTDDNLKHRGLCFVSMCFICNSHEETSNHLFFIVLLIVGFTSPLVLVTHHQPWNTGGIVVPLDPSSARLFLRLPSFI